jgi:hypothetical protein
MSSDSVSSQTETIIKSLLGEDNPYLKNLIDKHLNGVNRQRSVTSKFQLIDQHLQEKINQFKKDVESNLPNTSFVINTILKEKLADRSEAIQERRQKFILAIIALIIPIVTNLVQYWITRST